MTSQTIANDIEQVNTAIAALNERRTALESELKVLAAEGKLSDSKEVKQVRAEQLKLEQETEMLNYRLESLQGQLVDATRQEQEERLVFLAQEVSERYAQHSLKIQRFYTGFRELIELARSFRAEQFAYRDLCEEARYLATLLNVPCPDLPHLPMPKLDDARRLENAIWPLGYVPSSKWQTLRGELIEKRRQDEQRKLDDERAQQVERQSNGLGLVSSETVLAYDPAFERHQEAVKPVRSAMKKMDDAAGRLTDRLSQ